MSSWYYSDVVFIHFHCNWGDALVLVHLLWNKGKDPQTLENPKLKILYVFDGSAWLKTIKLTNMTLISINRGTENKVLSIGLIVGIDLINLSTLLSLVLPVTCFIYDT